VVLTVERLADIAPNAWSDLRFTLHPSVQRVALTTNVVAIAKAAADGLSLPRPATQARTEWLIWRQDLEVQYRSLDALETAAMDALIAGATFGEMCETLIAAGLLKRWIVDQCLADFAPA
jgi:hypothetical protein